jgi:carboxyl-terminal processing protease
VRYDDPRWYEQQIRQQGLVPQPQQPPMNDDFDHYPFLPTDQVGGVQQVAAGPQKDPIARVQRILGSIVVGLVLVVLAFLAGWFSHQYFAGGVTQSSQSRQYEQMFDQAWQQVDQNYVDRKSVDYKKMSYAAISAMVQTLNDPGHTRFLTPQDVQTENNELNGPTQFVGIGINIRQDTKTKQIIITSPIPGAPAYKAGVKSGDIITAVNGVSVQGKDVNAVSAMIHGNAGTVVTLTIQRPSQNNKTYVFKITRATINVPNVTMYYIAQDHTAHIQIVQFASGVSDQVRADVIKAKQEGATKIILDLRDNPGGLLDEAINTSSLFLKSGDNVLIEQDSTGQRTPVAAQGNPIDTTIPLVVLVNENSASAAEITAGALQDNHRATIIGVRTFGTGTVLQQFSLSDGSALLLGTQEWLTPDGHFIRTDSNNPNGGIKPDITVKLNANGAELFPDAETVSNLTAQQILNGSDNQLSTALKYLQSK